MAEKIGRTPTGVEHSQGGRVRSLPVDGTQVAVDLASDDVTFAGAFFRPGTNITASDIERKYGVTPDYVRGLADAHLQRQMVGLLTRGIPDGNGTRTIPDPAQATEQVLDYLETVYPKRRGRDRKVPQHPMHNAIVRARREAEIRAGRKPETSRERAYRLFTEGVSPFRIAQQLNISLSTLSWHVGIGRKKERDAAAVTYEDYVEDPPGIIRMLLREGKSKGDIERMLSIRTSVDEILDGAPELTGPERLLEQERILFAAGFYGREVAAILGISEVSVRSHTAGLPQGVKEELGIRAGRRKESEFDPRKRSLALRKADIDFMAAAERLHKQGITLASVDNFEPVVRRVYHRREDPTLFLAARDELLEPSDELTRQQIETQFDLYPEALRKLIDDYLQERVATLMREGIITEDGTIVYPDETGALDFLAELYPRRPGKKDGLTPQHPVFSAIERARRKDEPLSLSEEERPKTPAELAYEMLEAGAEPEEIAPKLGVSQNSLRTYLSNGRAKARAAVGITTEEFLADRVGVATRLMATGLTRRQIAIMFGSSLQKLDRLLDTPPKLLRRERLYEKHADDIRDLLQADPHAPTLQIAGQLGIERRDVEGIVGMIVERDVAEVGAETSPALAVEEVARSYFDNADWTHRRGVLRRALTRYQENIEADTAAAPSSAYEMDESDVLIGGNNDKRLAPEGIVYTDRSAEKNEDGREKGTKVWQREER